MSDQENKPPAIPYLSVESHGETKWFDLDSSSNSLIGSGGHCKVQLEGSDVRSLHCILAMKEDGRLEVRDWNTSCTFVNGVAISEPTELKEGDLLKIGDNEITAVLTEEGAKKANASVSETESEETEPEVSDVPSYEETSATNELVETETPDVESVVKLVETIEDEAEQELETQQADEALLQQDQPTAAVEEESSLTEPQAEWLSELVSKAEPDAAAEPEVVELPESNDDSEFEPNTVNEPEPDVEPVVVAEPQPEAEPQNDPQPQPGFVYDIDADFEDEADGTLSGFSTPEFADDLSSDELQTLRLENEQLKFELAQRDASPTQNVDLLNREQTMRLLSRLEELLDELKCSDARALQMEELLRSADQATQDEQEERQHIEKWVSELESRVTQRESETEAEIQQLKKLLDEARESQQKSNDSLQNVIDSTTAEGESVPAELVTELRNRIELLQTQLKSAQDEAGSLREQLEQPLSGAPSQAELRESEQKLAEMQLESSRERAEVSRQRVELKRLKADLEERLGAPRVADVADTRIRAMREHLKELHDEEELKKDAKREANGGGLANRIASLLQRVAGD